MISAYKPALMCATVNGVPQALFVHQKLVPRTIPVEKSKQKVLGSPRSEQRLISHTPTLRLDIIA